MASKANISFADRLKTIFGGSKGPKKPAAGGSTAMTETAINPQTETKGDGAAAPRPRQTARGLEAFRLPGIGHMPLGRQLSVLGILAGLFAALLAMAIFFYINSNREASAYDNIAAQMKFHTQRLAKSAETASRGFSGGFAPLKDSRDEFSTFLKTLTEGGDAGNFGRVSPLAGEARTQLDDLNQRWPSQAASASAILAAQNDLTNLAKNVGDIRLGAEDLTTLSQELTGIMGQAGIAPAQVLKASRLSLLAERLSRGSAEILGATTIDPEVPFLIGKDTNDIRELLKGLESGSDALGINPLPNGDARNKLNQIKGQFGKFETSVGVVLRDLQKLVAARQAASSLASGSEQLLSSVTRVQDNLGSAGGGIPLIVVLSVLLGLTVLAGVLAYLAETARQAKSSDVENKRNQEAILRLLNEMGDLADGDLTVRAKVTEDITGAIADSMNYTIEELRTLVVGVNSASQQVNNKTREAEGISNQLLAAAEKQSKEIEDTSAQVLRVAESITEVSKNAEQGAQVARASLSAADQGSKAVQASITGMNDIREQIQDTAKRIKRLGESSQEIGEIVELISDITEQTNVLALNAAIQAASAGEAGRGFSVVAEEVQRLAERSAEATKQIGAIVKTIQADTQDAVAAMEKSTQGVVEGAKLSDNAGKALSEIDRVTKDLATLIQQISSATQVQAKATNQVAQNMQDILEITRQTTRGTQQTAVSVRDLTKVANELRSSVSGFKL